MKQEQLIGKNEKKKKKDRFTWFKKPKLWFQMMRTLDMLYLEPNNRDLKSDPQESSWISNRLGTRPQPNLSIET